MAEGDKADVDAAVDCARKAFEQGKWPSFTPHQRARCLLKIAELMETARRRAGTPRNAEQRDGDFVGSRNGGRGDRDVSLLRWMGHQDLGRDQSLRSSFFNYTLRDLHGDKVGLD